eukprot:2179595-Pyramimonas_sp.AAC.2
MESSVAVLAPEESYPALAWRRWSVGRPTLSGRGPQGSLRLQRPPEAGERSGREWGTGRRVREGGRETRGVECILAVVGTGGPTEEVTGLGKTSLLRSAVPAGLRAGAPWGRHHGGQVHGVRVHGQQRQPQDGLDLLQQVRGVGALPVRHPRAPLQLPRLRARGRRLRVRAVRAGAARAQQRRRKQK